MTGRLAGATFAVIGALGAMAAPVAASPTWVGPTPLDPTGAADGARIAFGASGHATAIWNRMDGGHLRLVMAVRPPGGPLSAPVTISSATGDVNHLDLAVDDQGRSVIGWTENGTNQLHLQVRGPDGQLFLDEFGNAASAFGAGGNVNDVRVAINDGHAAATWSLFDAGVNLVEKAIYSPSSNTWGGVGTVSNATTSAYDPIVSISETGNVRIHYRQYFDHQVDDTQDGIYLWRWSSGDGQGARLTASKNVYHGGPATAGYAAGSHHLAYTREHTPSDWRIFMDDEEVALSTDVAFGFDFAADDQGHLFMVWVGAAGGGNYRVYGLMKTAEGSIGFDVGVPRLGIENARIASRAGTTVVVWPAEIGSTDRMTYSLLHVGNGGVVFPDPEQTIQSSTNGGSSDVSVDGQGNAIVAYDRVFSLGNDAVGTWFSGLDVSGPMLTNVQIPPAAVLGQNAAFSVTPVDQFSALGTTSWSFGDGANATGTAVSHAFGALGAFPIGVSASDTLGHTTTATGQTAVTAAEPGGSGGEPPGPGPGPSPGPGQPLPPPPPPPGSGSLATVPQRLTKAKLTCARRRRGLCKVTVAFVLSKKAAVTFTVKRGSKRTARFKRTLRAGARKVVIPTKALRRRGRYSVTIKAPGVKAKTLRVQVR